MTPREHKLRIALRYEGDDNTVASRQVERLVDGQWQPWNLDIHTPGFLIYTYALAKCQELFFRMNCAERGLVLDSAQGELEVYSEDFHIQRSHARFTGKLRSGTPTADDIAWICQRMRVCPVSRNLGEQVERVAVVELS